MERGEQMVIKKAKEHAARIKLEFRRNAVKAILAALAFVIALVWRDAIRKTIDSIVERMGIPETAYAYEFIIAAVLTVICVIGIMIVSKYKIEEVK
jgi:hypothetical protein